MSTTVTQSGHHPTNVKLTTSVPLTHPLTHSLTHSITLTRSISDSLVKFTKYILEM